MVRLLKRFSQNFLRATEFAEELAECIPLAGRKVLEIGPGDGVVTAELASRAKAVVAVEADARLVPALERRFAGVKNVKVVHADALDFDFSGFPAIVGSLPYHIVSPLVLKAVGSGCEDAAFIVQAEVGQRMVAQAGTKDYSRLSVAVQARCSAEIVDFIPRACFEPTPRVDSVLVRLHRLEKPAELSEPLVAALFQHKNQAVRNALVHSPALVGRKGKGTGLVSDAPLANRKVTSLSVAELEQLSRWFEPVSRRG